MEEKKTGTPAHRGAERQKRQKRGIGRKIGFVLLTLFLIGVCTTGMIAGIFLKYVDTALGPTLEVRAEDYTMNLSSVVYYQDKDTGEWVEFQKIHGVENRIWVDIEDMPDALWQAAVAIEDERFFLHNGVDWWRTAGATVNMFLGMRNTFGGSTITQQLLKNITEYDDNTVNRKVTEIFRALEFEKNYTKSQILELYLNTIFLGQHCYGVQTAAEFYFGKDVSELDVAECASLIAITNNPSMYGPMYDIEITFEQEDGTEVVRTPRELNKQRQENILKKMSEVSGPATLEEMDSDPDAWEPFLTEEEYETAKSEVLQFSDGSTSAEDIVAQANSGMEVDNWFVEQVVTDVAQDLAEARDISEESARILLNNSGYQIYTTMDPDIQAIVDEVYSDASNLPVVSRKGEQLQSGITIMDPYTGDIVAMAGAVGEKEGNRLWNYAVSQRQVGSSIKPLTVYAPAIDSGVVTPATTFDDYPVQLMNGSPWPKNSPNNYGGWTSVQDGIRRSVNTVAVQTLQKLGYAESFAFATEKLGLSLVAEDMSVSPLGLGGLTYGLNTVEMAAAYSAFANSGVYNSPRMYVEVRDSDGNVILSNETETHVAMKETTADLMTRMLQNVVSSGTGTAANFGGMSIAGKTGTTSDMRDRYFVGYTPYYCAAVWTGYKSNDKISANGNPAVNMWRKVMERIHQELPNKSFNRVSSGLETVYVCADSGLLCTEACHADLRGDRQVAFTVVSGTAPTEYCTLHTTVDYCTEGKCLATENCPAESVTQVGVLDYTRENYGSSIKAGDDAYLLSNMEKAIGLQPTVSADGTATYPAVIGCPVHTEPVEIPEEEDPEHPDGEEPPEEEPGTDPPEEPTQNPDDPGGTEDDGGGGSLWEGLWSTISPTG